MKLFCDGIFPTGAGLTVNHIRKNKGSNNEDF